MPDNQVVQDKWTKQSTQTPAVTSHDLPLDDPHHFINTKLHVEATTPDQIAFSILERSVSGMFLEIDTGKKSDVTTVENKEAACYHLNLLYWKVYQMALKYPSYY
jgi:hypothetical protein